MRKKLLKETELAAFAKQTREKAGKSKAEAARELGVHRATITLAEEKPGQSLTKLRIRIMEKYSPYRVEGPVFILKRK